MSHHDVHYWQGNLLRFEKEEHSSRAMAIYDKVLQLAREGQAEDQKADFPNSTRTGPVEWRFRGSERLAKLKELKRRWDLDGVFTTEFMG